MGSKRVLLFVPKTIEDNRLPWLRQGSFLKKYNMVQRVALATTGFLSLEEYNMLQKITMATTGFLSFTTPYLESSKGCGTRGHLTLGLVAIYSKKKYLGLIKFGDFSLEKKGLYDCGKQEEKNQTNY